MAFEKAWPAIAPTAFTANGTTDGTVTIASTVGFYSQQRVILHSSTTSDILLQVKQVLSATTLKVGPEGSNSDTFSDISTYLVANSATIAAPLQSKPAANMEAIMHAVYEREPVVALRVFQVDSLGNPK